MRLLHLFTIAVSLCFSALATNNGLQTIVEWDNGSLMVNGERVLIMSGEFRMQPVYSIQNTGLTTESFSLSL